MINPLEYMGACNLGSLFVHYFVEKPFTKEVTIDYDKLKHVIHTSVRFLDNIIDINKFPLPQFENYQKNVRTIGLGFTGLADLLVMFNLVYGSEEAIKFTDELTNFITKEAYKASIELAKEKGHFPFLNKEKFVKSQFIQKHIKKDNEWKDIANDILQYGIRNARIISIAPTGTLSLTFGNNCSSGLEPIFSLSYDRKVKIGGQDDKDIQTVKMQDYAYGEWLKIKDNKDCIVTEDKFVTAMNLSVDAHLDMLKVIAFNTDMSCSKTINIPTDYSFEDTKKVYDKCYQYGIKGCTIFRPNPIRQGILITEGSKEEFNQEVKLPRGFIEDVPEGLSYRKYKLATGCSNLYFFLGVDESEGKIYDCFCNTDGVNGCPINTQAVSRLLSAGIRGGIPIEYLVTQLSKAGVCPSFQYKRGKGEKLCDGKSCASAIGNVIKKVLKEFSEEELVKDIHIENEEKNKLTQKDLDFIKKNGEVAFAKHFNKCPVCGKELANIDGCISCNQGCGWSKCG